MNRGFIFDSWYWIISIRYCIIRIVTEQTLSLFPSNERKIIGHQIASIKLLIQFSKTVFTSNQSKTKTVR